MAKKKKAAEVQSGPAPRDMLRWVVRILPAAALLVTGVVVFQRPTGGAKNDKKARQREKVWFYDIRADGFDPDKISGGGRPETPERNDIPDLLVQWNDYKKSGYKKPPGDEAEALLPSGTEDPHCWWATVKTITHNDYNLAASRYKPQIAQKAPDEDPVQLIREVLEAEREIESGLEKLLQDVEAAL